MHKRVMECLLCHTPLQIQFGWQQFFVRQLPETICAHCAHKFERITEQKEQDAISLFTYNDAMKDYIHRYKFLGDVQLAKVFSRVLYDTLKEEQAMIVPIPMHPENLKSRTFAPVDELLRAAEIPFVHMLKKITTETQVGKTREERLAVVKLFALQHASLVEGKDILLFDDLYTTGTTVKHARKELLGAGAKRIRILTLIHG